MEFLSPPPIVAPPRRPSLPAAPARRACAPPIPARPPGPLPPPSPGFYSPAPAATPIEENQPPSPSRLDKQAAISLGIGLALAVLAASVSPLKFIFSYLTIAIHELGHAVFGWLFGYPSIPAFDFRYGGGFAVHRGRSTIVLIGVYAAIAAAGWLYRRNRRMLCMLAALLALHALVAYTAAHHVVILFMGHGAELLLAGVFLYRAMSGRSIVRAVERPLYAFCGLFILICDIVFVHGLMTHRGKRILYEAAKGGGHWMDFSRIAERHLHVDLTAVASFFLLCCLTVPVASFLAFRYQQHLRDTLRRS